jgi:hypothetical protein
MAFLSNKVLQSDCSGNSKAGGQLWSEPTESAKVLWKDCFSILEAPNESIASYDEKWRQQNWIGKGLFLNREWTRIHANKDSKFREETLFSDRYASTRFLWTMPLVKFVIVILLYSREFASIRGSNSALQRSTPKCWCVVSRSLELRLSPKNSHMRLHNSALALKMAVG